MGMIGSMIEKFRQWARLAPLPPGPMPDGEGRRALGLPEDGQTVLMMMDSNGRVFQITNAKVMDGNFRQVANGRTAVLELMDSFGVADAPDWDRIAE